MFDGEAVAIPSRDVGYGTPLLEGDPVDDVLQDLVHGVAHVEVAVCIGRSVVQYEKRASFRGSFHLFVKVFPVPHGEVSLFLGREVRLHWKVCLGQVQGVLEIHNDSLFDRKISTLLIYAPDFSRIRTSHGGD